MGLRFMQRGNDNKAATPAPVVTKSKFRPAAPTTAQASTSPAPMELVDSGPGMTIGSSKDLEDGTCVGRLLVFNAVRTEFAQSSPSSEGDIAARFPYARLYALVNCRWQRTDARSKVLRQIQQADRGALRSFSLPCGCDGLVQSLGKPLVSSSAAERTAKAESSSSDSSDEESDSSLDVVETAAPPPRKRPKPSSDTLPISGKNGMLAKGGKVSANGGFMRPKGFEAQQEGGGKKKRKRTKM